MSFNALLRLTFPDQANTHWSPALPVPLLRQVDHPAGGPQPAHGQGPRLAGQGPAAAATQRAGHTAGGSCYTDYCQHIILRHIH